MGRRLDRVLRKTLPRHSLGSLHKALRKKLILVNRGKAPPNYHIEEGDILLFKGSLAEAAELCRVKVRNTLPPGDWKILWEDENLLIIDKPRGRLVHGKNGLDEEVRAYLESRIPESLSFRPGPLHRLDRGTTGILTFGRSLKGARLFTQGLMAGSFVKDYLTLLKGDLPKDRVWQDRLVRRGGISRIDSQGGAEAKTAVFPLVHTPRRTLAVMRLYTGRTHQIRAQAAYHGHPLEGDKKYGGPPLKGGYCLHAWRLRDENQPSLFPPISAPPPPRLRAILTESFSGKEILPLLEGEIEAPEGPSDFKPSRRFFMISF